MILSIVQVAITYDRSLNNKLYETLKNFPKNANFNLVNDIKIVIIELKRCRCDFG